MALYAYDEGKILIYAADAKERHSYKCIGCDSSVRVRKGPKRIAHFYHLRKSATCRLFGKSEDHLFAQLSIQKMLPVGEVVLEKSFSDILRVADLVWEPQKIIFEIQCSLIQEMETQERVNDYLKIGYQVVWILDDRIFNRKIVRSAEKWMRQMPCYYATVRGQPIPFFYDQFEIFHQERRVKKGQRLKIELHKPSYLPKITFEEDLFPKQIIQKAIPERLYFKGDLLHKALLSHAIPTLAISMQTLRHLELSYEPSRLNVGKTIYNITFELLGCLMHYLQKANEKWG